MRIVEGGDGRAWSVFVEWEGRRPLRRSFTHWRNRREFLARRRAGGREKAGDSWLDGCSGCGDFANVADAFALVALAFAAIVLLVVVGPWVVALVFGIIELGVLLVAAVVGLVWRTALRRPWRVVAIAGDGELWAWRLVGWRGAQRLVDVVADRLDAGALPGAIEIDALEPSMPSSVDPDAPLGFAARDGGRFVTLGLAVVVVIAATVALVVGLR